MRYDYDSICCVATFSCFLPHSTNLTDQPPTLHNDDDATLSLRPEYSSFAWLPQQAECPCHCTSLHGARESHSQKIHMELVASSMSIEVMPHLTYHIQSSREKWWEVWLRKREHFPWQTQSSCAALLIRSFSLEIVAPFLLLMPVQARKLAWVFDSKWVWLMSPRCWRGGTCVTM